MRLTNDYVRRAVEAALMEDAPWGDVTTWAFVPEKTTAFALLVAREPGVAAGVVVTEAAFLAADNYIVFEQLVGEGQAFDAGSSLARIDGSAHAILRAERVALNFVRHLSGIATLTARFVKEVAGTKARIVDTRKTTPGLRALERHAVRCGGATNHRWSLSDAILLKDNHIAAMKKAGIDVVEALLEARRRIPHTMTITIEVDELGQIEDVLTGKPDVVLLDNFSIEDMRKGVDIIGGRALVEASGNVTLDNVRAVAETGVDLISIGALTHSSRSLDMALDLEVAP